jgi:hypothetical protein
LFEARFSGPVHKEYDWRDDPKYNKELYENPRDKYSNYFLIYVLNMIYYNFVLNK